MGEPNIRNSDLVKEFLQETSSKLYEIGLYFLFLDSACITLVLVYLILKSGLTTSETDYAGLNEDCVKITAFFVFFTSTLTLLVGIRALRTLNDREQYRFTTFLRVLLELMLVLIIFFIIIAILDLQIYFVIGLGAHIILFGLIYFKSRDLERLLSSKRRNELKEEYFKSMNMMS